MALRRRALREGEIFRVLFLKQRSDRFFFFFSMGLAILCLVIMCQKQVFITKKPKTSFQVKLFFLREDFQAKLILIMVRELLSIIKVFFFLMCD